MNHAPRNAATQLHTKRRRTRSMSVSSGPAVASPPAAAALEVPTAGVPTYRTAAPWRVTGGGPAGAAGLAATAGLAGAGAAATAAGAAAAAAAGASPASAAISASLSRGSPFRFLRACSAATEDLFHLG